MPRLTSSRPACSPAPRGRRSRLGACAAALLIAATASVALPGSKAQAAACEAHETFSMAIHGGTARRPMTSALEARKAFQTNLLTRLRAELAAGATALDTAEAAVRAMEDSGLFNAGKASIANAKGFIETDAAIMDGRTREAGAVASMRLIKNPVTAARLVMDSTRHVMMVGDRGEKAVTDLGAETVGADYFVKAKPAGTGAGAAPMPAPAPNPGQAPAPAADPHGTVGAVVLDRCGNLAAATSTGGYDAKIPGRVGDTPILGAGTYAQNGVAAVSATGHGEYFIRFAAGRTIAARVEFGGESPELAATETIAAMADAGAKAAGEGRTPGLGGVIVVGADGTIATPFSTPGMVRATTTQDQEPKALVFDTE